MSQFLASVYGDRPLPRNSQTGGMNRALSARRGDLIHFNPRVVVLDTAGGANLPAKTPIDGPYWRIRPTAIRSNEQCPGAILSAQVGMSQASIGTRNASVPVLINLGPISYYEVDALANQAIVMPFDGDLELFTPIARTVIYDVYQNFPGESCPPRSPAVYHQTRDVPADSSATIQIPMGCVSVSFVTDSTYTARGLPPVTFNYETATQAGPPASTFTPATVVPAGRGVYTFPPLGAFSVTVDTTALGQVKVVFDIVMP